MSPVSFYFLNAVSRKFEIACETHILFLLDNIGHYRRSQGQGKRGWK